LGDDREPDRHRKRGDPHRAQHLGSHNATPYLAVVDFCVAVESAPASGKWAVDGVADYATGDGIHWSVGVAAIAAQKVPVTSLAVSVPANALGYADTYSLGMKTVQASLDTLMGQAGATGVTKLTTDANHSYAPYIEGRQFHDSAALTSDRKLILVTTNANGVAIPDGHRVRLSRKGSSGSHNRAVYQADGTTLIVNVADSGLAAFTWSLADALWYQSG